MNELKNALKVRRSMLEKALKTNESYRRITFLQREIQGLEHDIEELNSESSD